MLPQAVMGTPAFRRINFGLFLGGFVTFAILWGMQALLPLFSKRFDVSPTTASFSLSASTLVLAVGMLLMSSFSDSFGRKRIMVVSVMASSLLELFIAFSPNFGFLILLRSVQGLTLSGLPAVAMTYLSEEVSGTSLGSAMGLYIAGNALGGMVSRIILSALSDMFGWRVAVGSVALLCILAGFAFALYLPVSKHQPVHRTRLAEWLPAFVVHLKNAHLQSLFGIAFFIMASFAAMYNYLAFRWLAPPYNLSQTTVGFVFVVYVVGIGSSAWMGGLSDRYGRMRILVISILLMAIGVVLTEFSALLLQGIGIGVFTFGFFATHAIASTWVGARAATFKAQASSLYLLFYYIGASSGGSFAGVLWERSAWNGVVVYLLVVLLFCALLAFRIRRTQRKQELMHV